MKTKNFYKFLTNLELINNQKHYFFLFPGISKTVPPANNALSNKPNFGKLYNKMYYYEQFNY